MSLDHIILEVESEHE
jgi:hypothetical protein